MTKKTCFVRSNWPLTRSPGGRLCHIWRNSFQVFLRYWTENTMPPGHDYHRRRVIKMIYRDRLTSMWSVGQTISTSIIKVWLPKLFYFTIYVSKKRHHRPVKYEQQIFSYRTRVLEPNWRSRRLVLSWKQSAVLSYRDRRSVDTLPDMLVYVFIAQDESGKQLPSWQDVKNELRHSRWERRRQMLRQDRWFVTKTSHKLSSGTKSLRLDKRFFLKCISEVWTELVLSTAACPHPQLGIRTFY